MKARVIVLTLLFVAGSAFAARGKKTIDLADLSGLSVEQLASLTALEEQVHAAEARIAAARSVEQESKGSLKAAKHRVEVEAADKNAAEAEMKAAKLNEDSRRIEAARKLLSVTTKDLNAAKALLEWRSKDHDLRETETRFNKLQQELSQAELELARLRLIEETQPTLAEKYNAAEIEKRVSERTAELTKVRRRIDVKNSETEKKRAETVSAIH